MTPIQAAFLKAGWIQVGGNDIPVFFRYEDNNPIYPFHVIYTVDSYTYYTIYNDWVKEGKLNADKIEVEKLIVGAYEHLRTTPKMFAIGVIGFISDFYQNNKNSDESIAYHYIEQYLTSKLKNGL